MASSEKPHKGILKTSSSFDKAECSHRGKEMKWDEMNILATHHPPDKDYGHMKIDEPPTPYSKCSEGEEEDEEEERGVERRGSFGKKDGMDPSSLSSKLENISGQKVRRVSTTEDEDSSSEEELSPEEREHKQKFEQKRKLHYNEFQAVKLAKQLMEEDDDDDDDEGSNKQNSVQTVTDDTTNNNSTDTRRLSETRMDSSGQLETQIN